MWGWQSLGRGISRMASTSTAGAKGGPGAVTKASDAMKVDEKLRISPKEGLEKAVRDLKINKSVDDGAAEDLGGKVLCRWNPNRDSAGPELLVMQGDLTACKSGAIVNAANTRLMHGGGLAGAIVRKGGESIQTESSAWIKHHGKMAVGDVVTTAAGKLPCKHVIHAAGPNVGHLASPTAEHAAELRRAVWNALAEADKLRVASVAIPGISTGIFGYPRDLGAQEIVQEAVRFCAEHRSTRLRRIAMMNIDDPTVSSFVKALQEAQKRKSTAEKEDISDQLAGLNIRD
ncbi:hypothetical protein PHYBOEH_000971 [Phytophthora boehmeriae]|uniref:Macro domain-containing protein n=1 Tax=Phytophthora boehmeriae TaxID=109152 RepID=A0A8T1WTY1_9STRA|nr:hypothetical protein PHYBOEH_000971 [Phytophthora boehmeriae]